VSGMKRWLSGSVLAVMVAAGAGCASLPAAAGVPIADVGEIVGKWAGTVTPGDEPFYLAITPGGTLTAAWGANMAWGTVTVRDGKATFEMQPALREGAVTLYTDSGIRRLVLDDQWGSFNARVTPQ
jgi:hypothetical protein